jgi:RHS repeat-associated protein
MFRDEVSDGRATDYLSVGPLAVRLTNGANPEYIHSDHLGSPVAATNASGAISWRENYTPFGEARVRPVGNANKPGYTGHVQDAATGLTYMQARYHDPVIGRFLAADPIGYQDQLNLYAYVHNDPVNVVDPDGRFGVAGFLAGAAFEALAQWSVTGSVSDWKAVGVAGAVGVVTGGVGGYAAKAALTGATTAGKAIAATGLAGGAAAAGGKHAEAALNGETASAAEAGVAAAGGTLGAGAGAKIANSAAATLGKMAASKDGVVSGMAATTRGAINSGGPAAVSSTVGSEAAQKSIDAGVAVGQKMVEEKMK